MLLSILVVSGALVGCIGGEDAPPEANTSDEDVEPASADETTNETTNDTTPSIVRSQTEEGTVTGVFVPVTGSAVNVPPASENTYVEFTTEDATEELRLNLTSEGGEISVGIDGPDCDAGPETAGCEFMTTSNGEASYSEQDPASGTWGLTFFAAEPVVVGADYELEIVQVLSAPG